MTAQALADKCAELGHPLDRSVIAKLEKGHRNTVTVADLLVLAKALGVPPALLVYPLGVEPIMETLPGERRPTWDALRWFTGAAAFPTEKPDPEPGPFKGTDKDDRAWGVSSAPLTFYEDHDLRVTKWLWEHKRVGVIEDAARKAVTDQERDAHEDRLRDVRERLAELEHDVATLRQNVRDHGMIPPPLPSALAAMIGENDAVLGLFRDHDELTRTVRYNRQANTGLADAWADRLRDLRRIMRQAGVTPPPLPSDLADIGRRDGGDE